MRAEVRQLVAEMQARQIRVYNAKNEEVRQRRSWWKQLRVELANELLLGAQSMFPKGDPHCTVLMDLVGEYIRNTLPYYSVEPDDIRVGEVVVQVTSIDKKTTYFKKWVLTDSILKRLRHAPNFVKATLRLYDARSLITFGRTTPRAAALIDASRCWGMIVLAWLLAEQFVPVWSTDQFPTDSRAYVWYAAFAVMGVLFGTYLYLASKAKGPADYRLMGRAVIQVAIAAGLFVAAARI